VPEKTTIRVVGGQYQCVGQPAWMEGIGWVPGVVVTVTQRQQGQPDESFTGTPDETGRFFVPVTFAAVGNVTFTATDGTSTDRTRSTAQMC